MKRQTKKQALLVDLKNTRPARKLFAIQKNLKKENTFDLKILVNHTYSAHVRVGALDSDSILVASNHTYRVVLATLNDTYDYS
jgi:hypothetical protein